MVHGILAVFLSTSALGQSDGAGFEDQINAGLQGEGVVTISDVGDLAFFGGAVTVPARRPSVEQCGIYISTPAEGRPKMLDEKRREATQTAVKQKYSPMERAELVKRAIAPLKACEADFKKKCDATIGQISLKVRKSAVDDVKKAIDAMVDPKAQAAVRGYLETVLKQCPLDT